MFCAKCGKQIPDSSTFCNFCGAQQEINVNWQPEPAAPAPQPVAPAPEPAAPAPQPVAPAPQPAAPAPQPAAPAPEVKPEPVPQNKKETKSITGTILLIIVIFIVCGIIGKLVIAPSMTPDDNENGGTNNSTPSGSNVSSGSYTDIFRGTNIVHFQDFFGMNVKQFAMKEAKGTIICKDFGYSGDTIKKIVETMYVPLAGHTSAEISEMESYARAQFAAYDALSCCTVTYNKSTNYFTATLTFNNVDQPANYTALYNAKYFNANSPVSMSATEKDLLSKGYAKK